MGTGRTRQGEGEHVDLVRRASIWERSIVPGWEARLVPALIAAMALPERGSILVAECRTGFVALELLARLGEEVRCIALDSSREMLDVARSKLPPDDRRIWWDAKSIEQTHYRDDVFGASVCAAGIVTQGDVQRVCRELVRLTQPQGAVGLVVPLRGTFAEFYDLYREALLAEDLHHYEPALGEFVASLVDAEGLAMSLTDAGVQGVEVHPVRFELSFASGEDFLLSPLVESLYLPYWLQICRDDGAREQIFFHVLRAMDTYFEGLGLTMTAEAAWVVGTVG